MPGVKYNDMESGESERSLRRSGLIKGDGKMKMRSVIPMRAAKIGYIVMSVLCCAGGVFLIAKPDVSALLLARVLGTALVLFGAVKIAGYFSKDLFRLAFQYDLEIGIISVVIGAIMLVKTAEALDLILAAIGIAVLTDALFKVRISLDSKRFGIGGWWIILLLAIVSGTVGALLVLRPWEGAAVLTVLLGVSLLSTGLLDLFVAICTVKIVDHQYPDFIEADYYEKEEDEK